VLVVGCGTGLCFEQLVDRIRPTGIVVGVEPAAAMLELAAERVAAVVLLTLRRYAPARVASALAVTTILVGWAVAQYPYVLVPDVTIEQAATGRATLQAMLVALAVGALFLVPALVYLYVLFQRSPPPQDGGTASDAEVNARRTGAELS
jgi:cytochrome bd-type quinol oxidase subunit 2